MIALYIVLGYVALCLLYFAFVTKWAEYDNMYKDTFEDDSVS